MNNNKNNLFSSLVGTGIGEIVTLPICTIKTNYQNTSSTSIIQTAKKIFKNNNIRGFYSASFPAIVGQMISTSSKYTIYCYLNNNKKYPIKNKFLNGMTAGFFTSLMTHPFDVTKIHWQMKTALLPEIRKNGFTLFYRGYSKTFTKIAVSSSLFFPIYDKINKNLPNPIVASSISGFISGTVMHPVDYLKTRHMAGLKLYMGLNPLLYYKGLSINLMRIVPHFMITMSTIEFLKSKL